ncbi:sensor histidine kinase [soil metagenome]
MGFVVPGWYPDVLPWEDDDGDPCRYVAGVDTAAPPAPGVVRAWLQADPYRADAIFGLLFAVVGVLAELSVEVGPHMRGTSGWSIGLGITAGAGVALRRRNPALAMTLAGVSAGIYGIAHFAGPLPPFAVLVTLYAEAAYGTRRQSITSLVISLAVVTAILLSYAPDVTWVDVVSNFALFAIPWFLGDNLRIRRALEVELEERARRAEADRAEAAGQAVAAERTRIARELHDVVAHAMGVMVIQAGAARRVLRRRPDDAEEAVSTIESTGREALSEMRRLVGVLRENAGLADRAPQPSLERITDLVAAASVEDLPVTLEIVGEPRPLPPGVDLAAYRIIQEALTNARRYAGRARVSVTIGYGPDNLTATVLDDGRGAAANPPIGDGPRHGLVGMQERVALYGGTLRVGPRAGGGFEVRASLPLDRRPATATTAPATA